MSKDYWAGRAKGYNKLQWTRNKNLIRHFIKACKTKKDYKVLDLGTGTGIIANALEHKCKHITAIDISKEMAQKNDWNKKKRFILQDIRKLKEKNEYDLVTMRMVLHHIMHNANKALKNAHTALKTGGRIVICEGIPPCKSVEKRYAQIFKLKEKRRILTEDNIKKLLTKAGFNNIKVENFYLPLNLENWLNNSNLTEIKKKKIMRLHTHADDNFKKAYHFRKTRKGHVILVKKIIVSGTKKWAVG